MKIAIKWLYDTHHCETCGCSYAEGAIVEFDGVVAIDLTPTAHCFGGAHYSQDEVFRRILSELGHETEVA